CRQVPAQSGRPLPHATDAEARRASILDALLGGSLVATDRRRGRPALPAVIDLNDEACCRVIEANGRRGCTGVSPYVSQRLLDDAVGSELDGRGGRPHLPVARQAYVSPTGLRTG